jgi:hypothetical protein
MPDEPETKRDIGPGATPPEKPAPPDPSESVPTPKKLNKRLLVSAIITPIALLGYCQTGADVLSPPLRRLLYLKIEYPAVLNYAYLLGPAIAAVVWLILLRKFPILSIVLSLLLCATLISVAGIYTDVYINSHTDKFPIGRFLTEEERWAIEDRLHFPIWQQSTIGGNPELSIARTADQHQRLLAELAQYPFVLPNTQPAP